MDAAENFFRQAGCVAVDLRVVSARTPLPSFYRHLGYLETGTAPFAPDVPAKIPATTSSCQSPWFELARSKWNKKTRVAALRSVKGLDQSS